MSTRNDFSWPVRVYYEDTDAGGIVYHAQYLHFLERTRTEWLRSLGFNQSILKEQGILFVVRDMKIAFKSPARLDDQLNCIISIELLKKASIKLRQVIYDDDRLLLTADVTVACLNANSMKPTTMPTSISKTMQPKEIRCE